jgi:cytochrome c553
MLHAIRLVILSLIILVSLYACGGQSSGESSGTTSTTSAPTTVIPPGNTVAQSGSTFYAQAALGCVSCHGADGQGGTFQAINTFTPNTCPSCTDVDTLAADIAATMPPGTTGQCSGNTPGTCAHDIAVFMMDSWINSNTPTPPPVAPTPGITVTQSANPTTDESGATTTIMVKLDSEPAFDVTLSVASSNTAEGTVGTSSLSFNNLDWSANKSIVVTGVDDGNVDGNITYSITMGPAVSADPDYSGQSVADVVVTNNDNDVAIPAGIIVTPTSGLITNEAGLSATFEVSLNSMPTADVSIGIASSNISEGTVAPASITFTSLNYNISQTITITGVDDAILDGTANYMITTSPAASNDPEYSMRDASDVSVINNDDELPPPAGVTVAPQSGLVTSEAGASDTFTIVLQSMPSANVAISLSSSNTAEGTVSANSLTFTTLNWNIQQTVTVTGQDDAVDDNDVQYSIVTGAPTSVDAGYDALVAADVADVTVTNTDDDLSQLEIGQQLYRQAFNMNDVNVTESCETCHGSTGLGNDPGQAVFGQLLSSKPVAPGTCDECASEAAFSNYTDASMPVVALSSAITALRGIGDGENAEVVCDQTCADAIAAYVFNNFSTIP